MSYENLTVEQLETKRFNSIFMIEMMERFGYYSFNIILVMFFIYQFKMSEVQAASLFGAFAALLYVFIPIGGWIGDSFLGTRKTILLGGIFLLIGYILLSSSMSIHMVFLGMGTIVIGNGLFKSNPASLLSKIFDKNDGAKRDAAYSVYYMAINIGTFVSMFISPIVAHKFGWQFSFILASVGILVGLLNFTFGAKYFLGIGGSESNPKCGSPFRIVITVIVAVILAYLCTLLLQNIVLTRIMMFTIVGLAFLLFLVISLMQKPGVRGKMVSALVLTLMAICFYTLYQQMSLSMTFFGMNNSRHDILGIPVHPEQFQIINPLVIIFVAPLLAFLYKKAGKKGKNRRITTKFAIGLFFSALSFLVLVPSMYMGHNGIVSSNFVVLSYILISLAELFVGALGASMMSQLVPEKLMGFAIGVWFLALAISGVTGSLVSNFTAPKGADTMTPVQSLPVFCHAFLEIGIITLISAVVMVGIKFILDRYIYTRKNI